MDNNTNTKTNNNTSIKPDGKDAHVETAIPVQFDKELLDTLRARHNSRYSRSEAFIDILCRMHSIDSNADTASAETKKPDPMESGKQHSGNKNVTEPSLFSGKDFDNGDNSQEQKSVPAGTPTSDFMSRHCVTNYSQLAAAWHWNRQTVLTFLRSLESDGVILFEQKNKTVEIFI